MDMGRGGENADCSIAVLGFNVQITSGISVPENNSYSSPTIVHEITCTVLLFHFFFLPQVHEGFCFFF